MNPERSFALGALLGAGLLVAGAGLATLMLRGAPRLPAIPRVKIERADAPVRYAADPAPAPVQRYAPPTDEEIYAAAVAAAKIGLREPADPDDLLKEHIARQARFDGVNPDDLAQRGEGAPAWAT